MKALLFILMGGALMVFAAMILGGWISGKINWFETTSSGKQGSSKTDRQLLDLYFLAIIITPLLCGAVLIIYGLRRFL